jgi:ADP-dependent NAD(P)H-hydrate dehydratase
VLREITITKFIPIAIAIYIYIYMSCMKKIIISVTPDLIQQILPARLASSRKGDNGIVLVVGGSGIYHGAPLLSTLSALRSGVDLVYTAVPKSNVATIRSFSPNIIALPFANDEFTIGSAKQLLKILPKKPDVVAIGMGMKIANPASLIHIIRELKKIGSKLLLDASALVPEILEDISGTNTIVTPHLGEYKRLFQREHDHDNDKMIDAMKTATATATTKLKEQALNVYSEAKKYGITIILKGYYNIICSGSYTQRRQQKHIAVIKRTTPAMTVGGCGDVLSGVVAGLLTKISDAFSASITGVYLTGMAGDLAYKRVGLHMVATDLIEQLPNVMKPFDKAISKPEPSIV